MPGPEDFVLVFEGLPGEEMMFAVPRGRQHTTPLIPPQKQRTGAPAPSVQPKPTPASTPFRPTLVPPPAPTPETATDALAAAEPKGTALMVPEGAPGPTALGPAPERLSGAAFVGILAGGAALLGIGVVVMNALAQSMDGSPEPEPESEPDEEAPEPKPRAAHKERELSLLYMEGCEACEEFKPTFESAIGALEEQGISVKRIEASGILPEGTPEVAAVPALVLREGDKTKILDGRKVMKRDWAPEDVVKFATSTMRRPRSKKPAESAESAE